MTSRFKWAMARALRTSIQPIAVIGIIAAFCVTFLPIPSPGSIWMLIMALSTGLTLKSYDQHDRMYDVRKVVCYQRDITFEVGHKDAFRQRYLNSVVPFARVQLNDNFGSDKGSYPAVTFDNDIVIVAVENSLHLYQLHEVLRERWPFYPLLYKSMPRRNNMSYDGVLSDNE